MLFNPGANGAQSSWPKVGMRRAGREDQVVVGEVAVIHEQEPAAGDVDAAHTGEQHVAVRLAPHRRADRRADVGRRKRGGRDLVEERLKDVVVPPVDDRHRDRRPGERLRGGEAAEAAAQR